MRARPGRRDQSNRRLRRRLIVPATLVERLESKSTKRGKTDLMLVEIVAVLVLLLMAGDVFRMLFVDTEPHGDPVRRDNS